MDTKELVLKYVEAWQKRDWNLLHSCLSSHYKMDGGQIQMPSPDTLIAFCKDGPSWSKVKLLELVSENDKAALLYEAVTPTGEKIRIGEFLTIHQNKITYSTLVLSLA